MARVKDYNIDLGGDIASMRRAYQAWTRAANERIRVTASKAGAQAYKNIVQPLEGASYMKHDKYGNVIFKGLGRNPSAAKIREAFAIMQRFMTSKTSTVAGIRKVKKQREEQMNKIAASAGIPSGRAGTGRIDQDSILRWLGSPDGVAAKQNYDSDLVIQAIQIDMVARPRGGTAWERFEEFEASGRSLAAWISDNQSLIARAFRI